MKNNIPYYFYNECQKCDTCDEAMLQYSGPHIKLICNECGAYIKFASPKQIPSLKELKSKISELLNDDLLKVEIMKFFIDFKKHPEGSKQEFKEYWRLYIHSRSKSI